MIMPRGSDQLLLPVNPLFIWIDAAAGASCSTWCRSAAMPAMPDFLALVLVFWNVHQPRRVGVGVAFVFGLLMDVHERRAARPARAGLHAAQLLRRSRSTAACSGSRVPSQAVQILPLFVAAQAVSLIVRMIAGGMFPGWELLLAPVFEALLWPVATWLLLAPQRRAPDPDENRPL